MAQIEKEAKLTISSRDYRAIREGGRVLECRDQLNVYLHDPSRLGEGAGYLRVRYQTGRSTVATVKIPKGWVGPVREMFEIQRPLAELGPDLNPRPRRLVGVAGNLPAEMASHFTGLGITTLQRLGWMRNLRCVIALGEDGTVELDRTLLPGGEVHHEVEIETRDSELLDRLVSRVMEMAPSARASTVGKFSRFLSAKGVISPVAPESRPYPPE